MGLITGMRNLAIMQPIVLLKPRNIKFGDGITSLNIYLHNYARKSLAIYTK